MHHDHSRQELNRAKPNARFGGGLRAAGESYASANVPTEMIGLVAALWASVAAVSLPVLFGFISKDLGYISGYQIIVPDQISILERLILYAVLFPLTVLMSAGLYFLFFGPMMALVTWVIKGLKLRRGIFDALGWMLCSTIAFPFWEGMMYWDMPYNSPAHQSAIVALLFPGWILSNGLGGWVYFLKQRQLHRALERLEGHHDSP